MKTILLSLSIIISIPAIAQWKKIKDGVQVHVSAVNANTCYISGRWSILKTEDSGVTWDSLPDSSDYSKFDFSSEKTGYKNIQKGNGMSLLKTMDGGLSWQTLTTPFYPSLTSMQSINDDVVFFHLGEKDFAKTLDGGKSFTEFKSPADISYYAAYHFIDHETGFVSTTTPYFDNVTERYIEQIHKTNDGGQNWSVVYEDTTVVDPDAEFSSRSRYVAKIYFSDKMIGYAVGSSNRILKTTDGGEHWSLKNHLPATEDLTCTDVVFEDNGMVGYVLAGTSKDVAFGNRAYIFRTTDGGTSWNLDANIGQGPGFPMFSKLYDHVLYVATNSGLYRREAPLSIPKNQSESNFILFPNPVKKGFSFSIVQKNADDENKTVSIYRITLTDMSGKIAKVMEWDRLKFPVNTLEGLSSGIYQLTITDNSGNNSFQKLVITD